MMKGLFYRLKKNKYNNCLHIYPLLKKNNFKKKNKEKKREKKKFIIFPLINQ